MSWSLKTRNGDLVLGTGQYATTKGAEKLIQDLRLHLLDKMGSDSSHPAYGSLINGGKSPSGQETSGVIGKPNDAFTRLQIESEIRRIVNTYQRNQLARAKDDKKTYGKVTFDRDEVLLSLTNIQTEIQNDSLKITLHIQTASNPDLTLQLNLS